jgi:hypothetical protein
LLFIVASLAVPELMNDERAPSQIFQRSSADRPPIPPQLVLGVRVELLDVQAARFCMGAIPLRGGVSGALRRSEISSDTISAAT